MNKNIIYGILLIAGGLLPLSGWAQLPEKSVLRPGQATMTNVNAEIEQILTLSESDIKAGIQGYGMNVAEAVKEKVMDEVIKALAEASVLSPAAVAILEVYQKKKDKKLAEAITEVKGVVKKALSTQLKVKYQDYKVDYERQIAHTRLTTPLKNSRTESVARSRMTGLYGNYTGVVDVFHNVTIDHDLIRTYDRNAGFYLIGTAANLADTKGMEAKLNLANREYNRKSLGGSEEIASLSAYERLVMKREVQTEARARQRELMRMEEMTRQMLQFKQQQVARQRYRARLGITQTRYTKAQ